MTSVPMTSRGYGALAAVRLLRSGGAGVTGPSPARRGGSGAGIALARLAGEMETTFPGSRTLPPVPRPAPDSPAAVTPDDDPGQVFVARLRAAAPRFATAAGALRAVVREAVPPARH